MVLPLFPSLTFYSRAEGHGNALRGHCRYRIASAKNERVTLSQVIRTRFFQNAQVRLR